MKIIFAGTPEFAVPCLAALITASYEVCAVYTQPDRPSGRGRRLTESPVKQLALQHRIPVYQPPSLRTEDAQNALKTFHADLMIVAAYGLILPEKVLKIPRLGCINVHASLLPRWRGAAPIQRAILAGDTLSGITIMQMDKGLDTGAMLYKTECPIHPADNAAHLHDRLAALAPSALLHTLSELEKNRITPVDQDDREACYAPKLEKQEAFIQWKESAALLERKIHAFNPWPVAQAIIQQQPVRLLEAVALPETAPAPAGHIIRANKQGIDVATAEGVLRVLKLQLPGGRPLSAADMMNAKHTLFQPGSYFE